MTDQEYFYKLLTLRDDTHPITRHDGGLNSLVSIFPEPLKVPCFHFTMKGRWEVVLSIREWKVLRTQNKKFKAGERLPRALENKIKSSLNVEMGDTGMTKWEWLLGAWDMENPGKCLKKEHEEYKMPE